MEFKCKYCNGTKYRQISVMVKQCEECGRQIISEGIPEKIDPDEIIEEEPKLKTGDGIWSQLKGTYYYIPKINVGLEFFEDRFI